MMDGRWWERAACADHDPSWWTSNGRSSWRFAAELCLGCPVSELCLAEARRRQDVGVVRGAVLLTVQRGRRVETPLVCPQCQQRPRQIGGNSIRPYCDGKRCMDEIGMDGRPAERVGQS